MIPDGAAISYIRIWDLMKRILSMILTRRRYCVDYITDQELYEKIVDRYESKKSNEDLFIMSISMQNHGGYTEKYDNFDEKARMLGINYPDVNQYLSLIHESDSALEYLISYFEKVGDPVEIVFFLGIISRVCHPVFIRI